MTPEQQARFDRWYASYPRKVSRADAEKAWRTLDPDDALTDRMISVVGLWATSQEWTKENGQFIPHPSTWLNKRRWEDAPPRQAQPQAERKGQWWERLSS